MTKEQQLFLDVLKNHLWGEKTEPVKDADWNTVFAYSNAHQMTAIVFSQCKDFIAEKYFKSFQSIAAATLYYNITRKDMTDRLIEKLKEGGVNALVFKGLEVAKFYPDWHLRAMGDTDLLVSDIPKADKIMTECGFKNNEKKNEGEWSYFKNDFEFEIHNKFAYDDVLNDQKIKDFFGNFEEFISDGKLDVNFHFMFVLLHLRKHFMKYGVGFRQFYDIAVLSKNCKELDWDFLTDALKKTGLYGFAINTASLNKLWFGIDCPLAIKELDKDFCEEASEYIFKNGVFGRENKDNKKQLQVNKIRESKYHYLSMIHSALKKIFPSYKNMAVRDNYSFIKGKPYLLPVAWIKRFYLTLKVRKSNYIKGTLSGSFVDKEYINRKEKMFEDWGLK